MGKNKKVDLSGIWLDESPLSELDKLRPRLPQGPPVIEGVPDEISARVIDTVFGKEPFIYGPKAKEYTILLETSWGIGYRLDGNLPLVLEKVDVANAAPVGFFTKNERKNWTRNIAGIQRHLVGPPLAGRIVKALAVMRHDAAQNHRARRI